MAESAELGADDFILAGLGRGKVDGEIETGDEILLDAKFADIERMPNILGVHQQVDLAIDRDGKLAGIVTRADLVRAFVHTDEEIAREIREEVLVHELWLNPEDFHVTVERGEVTVDAPTQTDPERELLTRRIGLVPGVVAVDVRAVIHV